MNLGTSPQLLCLKFVMMLLLSQSYIQPLSEESFWYATANVVDEARLDVS